MKAPSKDTEARQAAGGSASGGSLTRLTLNLTQTAADALRRMSEETRMTKTDLVNRALQMEEKILEIQREGGSLIAEKSDGTRERIYFV